MRPRSIRPWAILGALTCAFVYALVGIGPESTPGADLVRDDSGIVRLYHERLSGEVVEGLGTVERVLRDDDDGSRHQRFILSLDSGHTLLVSHNIDLAPRIADLRDGDEILFRGQYEWNDRGGVLHWTHHDPDGRRPGGWLQHRGATYR